MGRLSTTRRSSTCCSRTRSSCSSATMSRAGTFSPATGPTAARCTSRSTSRSRSTSDSAKRHWDNNFNLLMATVEMQDFPTCEGMQRGFPVGRAGLDRVRPQRAGPAAFPPQHHDGAGRCGTAARRAVAGRPGRISPALDALHIGVAEPEMMADLVDQHVLHDGEQIVAALAPISEDRLPIEKDHVDLRDADR